MTATDKAHQAGRILAALAPHVAALVRAERAAALREAADAVPPGPHPNGCLALSCGECARRYERDGLRDMLRYRAAAEENTHPPVPCEGCAGVWEHRPGCPLPGGMAAQRARADDD